VNIQYSRNAPLTVSHSHPVSDQFHLIIQHILVDASFQIPKFTSYAMNRVSDSIMHPCQSTVCKLTTSLNMLKFGPCWTPNVSSITLAHDQEVHLSIDTIIASTFTWSLPLSATLHLYLPTCFIIANMFTYELPQSSPQSASWTSLGHSLPVACWCLLCRDPQIHLCDIWNRVSKSIWELTRLWPWSASSMFLDYIHQVNVQVLFVTVSTFVQSLPPSISLHSLYCGL